MQQRAWAPGTLAVHAGDAIDAATGSVVPPIVQSSTFAYPQRPVAGDRWEPATWFYTRYANPTVAAAEAKVAALEGAQECKAFASGMAAMAASIFAFVRSGDRVAAMEGIYGGTQALLAHHLPALGVSVDSTRELDPGVLGDLVQDATRVVVTETPTNPFNRVFDLPEFRHRLDRRWGKSGPVVVCDATFATPLNLRPLARGADLAMHSATKYLNGHTDLIGGTVSGRRSLVGRLESWRRHVGACMDPHQAFLLSRGLKTLEIRLRRAEANARVVARALEADRRVARVWHLSLPSHPDHALARRLLKGPGAIVTFQLRGSRLAAARRFMRGLRLFAPAPSLGGVESLVSLPSETSHAAATPLQRKRQGITSTTVRLAVGIEDPDDLVHDVRAAMRRV